MAKDLDKAHKRLEDEYGQFRRHIDSIHDAFDQVVSAGMEDDIEARLKKLEDVVQEVRHGGLIGSGAQGHTRALEDYREAQATK